MTIIKHGKTWNLRRRVPKRYEAVEARREVWISLRTGVPPVPWTVSR